MTNKRSDAPDGERRRRGHPGMRLALSLLMLWLAVGGGHALAQKSRGQNPGQGQGQSQVMADTPQSWEIETEQAGGKGVGNYKSVGALRCKTPGEAIVGARLMRGDVVDAIQIGCAAVSCSDDGDCQWQNLDRGMAAGEPGSKSRSSIAVCPHDQIIAGYRARVKVIQKGGSFDYLADLEFECAKILGSPVGFGDDGPDAGLPVARDQRTWLPFPDAPSAAAPDGQAGGQPDKDAGAWAIEAHCEARGISAVSFGVGRYVPTGASVLQAMSLFCVQSPPVTAAMPKK